MRRWRKKIRDLAVSALDLPEDLVHGVPRMILTGDMRLAVERHQGVDLFSGELLRLKLEEGKLEIAGQGLVIRTIGRDEVQVEGKIERIQFVK